MYQQPPASFQAQPNQAYADKGPDFQDLDWRQEVEGAGRDRWQTQQPLRSKPVTREDHEDLKITRDSEPEIVPDSAQEQMTRQVSTGTGALDSQRFELLQTKSHLNHYLLGSAGAKHANLRIPAYYDGGQEGPESAHASQQALTISSHVMGDSALQFNPIASLSSLHNRTLQILKYNNKPRAQGS